MRGILKHALNERFIIAHALSPSGQQRRDSRSEFSSITHTLTQASTLRFAANQTNKIFMFDRKEHNNNRQRQSRKDRDYT